MEKVYTVLKVLLMLMQVEPVTISYHSVGHTYNPFYDSYHMNHMVSVLAQGMIQSTNGNSFSPLTRDSGLSVLTAAVILPHVSDRDSRWDILTRIPLLSIQIQIHLHRLDKVLHSVRDIECKLDHTADETKITVRGFVNDVQVIYLFLIECCKWFKSVRIQQSTHFFASVYVRGLGSQIKNDVLGW